MIIQTANSFFSDCSSFNAVLLITCWAVLVVINPSWSSPHCVHSHWNIHCWTQLHSGSQSKIWSNRPDGVDWTRDHNYCINRGKWEPHYFFFTMYSYIHSNKWVGGTVITECSLSTMTSIVSICIVSPTVAVGPSVKGCQWIIYYKCQTEGAYATSCSDHPRGNWAVHWVQAGDSWMVISWPSHSRTLQIVGLSSSVSTMQRQSVVVS